MTRWDQHGGLHRRHRALRLGKLPKERSMSREIYEWRRMPVPTESFRRGQRNAATYDLENTIDHLKSSVDGLLGDWGEGLDRDFAAIIQGRRKDVERSRQLLAQAGLSSSAEAPYAAYLESTRSLLKYLAAAHRDERSAR